MNLNIRQGTNEAWFIYNDNKVILGSQDKELIEKVFSFLNGELISTQFAKLSEQKPFIIGNYEAITNRGRIIKIKGEKLMNNWIWETKIDNHNIGEEVIAWRFLN